MHDTDDLLRKVLTLRARIGAEFEKMAGEDLAAIMASRDTTETFLSHENKCRRLAAIWALTSHWPRDNRTAELLKYRSVEDAEIEVRHAALIGLGTVFGGSADTGACRFLATTSLSEDEPAIVREGAYRALFAVAGTPLRNQPPFVGFVLERDLDRRFVEAFLKE